MVPEQTFSLYFLVSERRCSRDAIGYCIGRWLFFTTQENRHRKVCGEYALSRSHGALIEWLKMEYADGNYLTGWSWQNQSHLPDAYGPLWNTITLPILIQIFISLFYMNCSSIEIWFILIALVRDCVIVGISSFATFTFGIVSLFLAPAVHLGVSRLLKPP